MKNMLRKRRNNRIRKAALAGMIFILLTGLWTPTAENTQGQSIGGFEIDILTDPDSLNSFSEWTQASDQEDADPGSVQEGPAVIPFYEEPLPPPSYESPEPAPAYQDPVLVPASRDPLPAPVYEEPQPPSAFENPPDVPAFESPPDIPAFEDAVPQAAFENPVPAPDYQESQPAAALENPLSAAVYEAPPAAFENPLPVPVYEAPPAAFENPLPTSVYEVPPTAFESPLPTPVYEDSAERESSALETWILGASPYLFDNAWILTPEPTVTPVVPPVPTAFPSPLPSVFDEKKYTVIPTSSPVRLTAPENGTLTYYDPAKEPKSASASILPQEIPAFSVCENGGIRVCDHLSFTILSLRVNGQEKDWYRQGNILFPRIPSGTQVRNITILAETGGILTRWSFPFSSLFSTMGAE